MHVLKDEHTVRLLQEPHDPPLAGIAAEPMIAMEAVAVGNVEVELDSLGQFGDLAGVGVHALRLHAHERVGPHGAAGERPGPRRVRRADATGERVRLLDLGFR